MGGHPLPDRIDPNDPFWERYANQRWHRTAAWMSRYLSEREFRWAVRDLVNLSNIVDDHGCILRPEMQIDLLVASGRPKRVPPQIEFMEF